MQFVGFQRGFNLGDAADFNYNKGARLWDLNGKYQFLSREERKAITIDGQHTVELDIGSSHLTIFLTMLNIGFDPTVDLYAIPGFDRQVVKRYANLTLSEPRIPLRWPKSMRQKFLDKLDYEIDAHHHISDVRDAVFGLYPILEEREAIFITWADLQFLEAEAVINAVDMLNQQHGVIALPVHDSIIVQERHKEIAIRCLKEAFYEAVGVYPRVSDE